MGIFSPTEIASKVFAQEETLMYVAGAKPFAQPVSKAFDDEDNEILGFIPNPGNTIATVFGIPLGTQFGTAMGMEGWGALAFDIISDPTTWLSVGAMMVPGGQAAGAAGLGATLSKHGLKASQVGVKMSKVQKAQRYLDGLSVAAKTESMAKIFKTAAQAAENPALVQKIMNSAKAGDTAGMFKGLDVLKQSSLKNRFYKLGDSADTILDIKKLEATSGLNKLRQAYETEAALKAASKGLFSFGDEATAALRYGFVGPKFLSKGVDILNTLPGVEALARGTNIITSNVSKGLNRGIELTGLSATKEAVMNSYFKHTAVVGAAKSLNKGIDEIIPRIQFEGNGSLIKLVQNGSDIAKEKAGLHGFTDRLYKSELDMVAGLGNAGRFMADTYARTRTQAEQKAGGLIAQLYKVGGRKSGIKNTLEDHITNKLSGKEKQEALDALSILKQDETYDDQVRTLDTMLQTGGVPLSDLHRYLEGGDLAKTERATYIRRRLPGLNRARRFANDPRLVPSKETQAAYKIMSNNSEVLAKNMEDSEFLIFDVQREMAEMSGDQIRKLKPTRKFRALRDENGRVMFSPHTGLNSEKRIADINQEIARQQAYDELAPDLAAGKISFNEVERRADEIIKNNDFAYTLARDDAYRMNKAESNLSLNSSANFSRNELGIVGYAADPLSRNFKSAEFFDKWSSYYAGVSQAIQHHASISGIAYKANLGQYKEILKRQGVSDYEIDGIIRERADSLEDFLVKQGHSTTKAREIVDKKLDKGDFQFPVTIAEEMTDAIVRETGDVKNGAHARRLTEHFLGNHVKKDTLPWQVVTQANKYQIVTKLTAVMSALTNLGQTANVLIDSGYHAASKAAHVAAKDLYSGAPGVADEIGTLAHNSVKDLDEGLNAFGGTIDTILEVYGFSTIERFNRRMSTYAGILTAEAMEKSLGLKTAKEGWESFWGRYEKTTTKMAKSYADKKAIKKQLEDALIPRTAREADIMNRSLPLTDEEILSKIDRLRTEFDQIQTGLGEKIVPIRSEINKLNERLNKTAFRGTIGEIDYLTRRIDGLKEILERNVKSADFSKKKLENLSNEIKILERNLKNAQGISGNVKKFIDDNRMRSVDQIMKEIDAGTFQGFNKAEVKQIATETVNQQQFRTSAVDVAEVFNNPLGSFVGIFMKFQFKQSEFFIKKVAKPGVEYIRSGGKKGNIVPLLTTLAASGVVGEALMDIKSLLNDRERTDHVANRLWEDYLAIGGAGFFSTALEPIATGTFNPFKAKQLAGANVNDLVKFSQALGVFITEGEDDKFYDELMKDLTHPLPARLRTIPRGALRSLKQDDESRQTQLEYDRFLDEQAADQAAADFGA
jgi:hypothetical protein